MKTLFVFAFAAVWQIGLLPATAESTSWVCSIIQDGKPEVIKFKVEEAHVAVSDKLSRLLSEFGTPGMPYINLKVVEDNSKGLIAVADGIRTEPGELSSFSTRILIVNKRTGALSYTWLSTRDAPVESKGNCTN